MGLFGGFAFGLSDPTRVGWIVWHMQSAIDSAFRPHACGVDLMNRPITTIQLFRPHACGVDDMVLTPMVALVFQTPRVWGGYYVEQD